MTSADSSFTRFQRLLLATDGTVTHVLEAYADEPVEVVKLLQSFEAPTAADVDLLLPPAGDVLRRRVVLRGARTHDALLHAEAVVAVDRVDPGLVAALLETDKPLGVLLAERRTETFREIVAVRREPAGDRGPHLGVDAAAEVISRIYRIVAGGRPAIAVTETFPASSLRTLSP